MTIEHVSLTEVIRAAQARATSLVPESSGYLVLAMAKAMGGAARRLDADEVWLSTEGSVALAGPRRTCDPPAAAAELRQVFRELLEHAKGNMPALAAAAQPRPERDVARLVQEVATALIPINHGAARRALARMARETLRARDRGQLAPPPRAPEAAPAATPPAQTDATGGPEAVVAAPVGGEPAAPAPVPPAPEMAPSAAEPLAAVTGPAAPAPTAPIVEAPTAPVEPEAPEAPAATAPPAAADCGPTDGTDAVAAVVDPPLAAATAKAAAEATPSAEPPGEPLAAPLPSLTVEAAPLAATPASGGDDLDTRGFPTPRPSAVDQTPTVVDTLAAHPLGTLSRPAADPVEAEHDEPVHADGPGPVAEAFEAVADDPAPERGAVSLPPAAAPLAHDEPPAAPPEAARVAPSPADVELDRDDEIDVALGSESPPAVRAATPAPDGQPVPEPAGASARRTRPPLEGPRSVESLLDRFAESPDALAAAARGLRESAGMTPTPPPAASVLDELDALELEEQSPAPTYRSDPPAFAPVARYRKSRRRYGPALFALAGVASLGLTLLVRPDVVRELADRFAPDEAAADPGAEQCRARARLHGLPSPHEVLLALGEAPLETGPVPRGVRLELVAMAPRHAPARIVVPADAPWREDAGRRVLDVATELVREDGAAWPAPPDAGASGGVGPAGTLRWSARPEGAELWLVVAAGTGGDAEVELPCGVPARLFVADPSKPVSPTSARTVTLDADLLRAAATAGPADVDLGP
ncbi:MAG: hypothetical protein IT373_00585 [Polyangiaceae bacterium]|nr:hypothetical protein [Polyangiaceae bacterium]